MADPFDDARDIVQRRREEDRQKSEQQQEQRRLQQQEQKRQAQLKQQHDEEVEAQRKQQMADEEQAFAPYVLIVLTQLDSFGAAVWGMSDSRFRKARNYVVDAVQLPHTDARVKFGWDKSLKQYRLYPSSGRAGKEASFKEYQTFPPHQYPIHYNAWAVAPNYLPLTSRHSPASLFSPTRSLNGPWIFVGLLRHQFSKYDFEVGAFGTETVQQEGPKRNPRPWWEPPDITAGMPIIKTYDRILRSAVVPGTDAALKVALLKIFKDTPQIK
jgi:hypothetical protein